LTIRDFEIRDCTVNDGSSGGGGINFVLGTMSLTDNASLVNNTSADVNITVSIIAGNNNEDVTLKNLLSQVAPLIIPPSAAVQ